MPLEPSAYHMDEAPAADTGQPAIAVRVISQLGGQGGGSGPSTVGLDGPTLSALETVNVGNFPASQAVTGPLTDAQLRAAAIPVSGPLTDAQLRAAALPVSGPLTDGQLRAAPVPVSGPVTDAQLRAAAVPVSGTVGVSNFPAVQTVEHKPASLVASATAAVGQGVTATLPAVAGQSHYITEIQVVKYATAAITGTATPVVVTTTNIGSLAFTFPTGQAIGTIVEQKFEPTNPVRSVTPNANTTVVCPATPNTIWRVNIFYYAA